jgi:phosphatidate cytidylyltransferase
VGDDRPSGKGDEEFEDLDRFFAPIEDVDWPEESEGPATPGRFPGRRRKPESEGDEALSGEEILPRDWSPSETLEGLDVERETISPPSEPPAEVGAGENERYEELRFGVDRQEAEMMGPTFTEGTAGAFSEGLPSDREFTADVEAGRDAFTEGPVDETFGDEARTGYPEPEGAEPELTIDDLTTAPAVYRDLPGPPGEETPGPEGPGGLADAGADHLAEALRGEEEEPSLTEGGRASGGTGETPPDELPVGTPEEVERELLSDLEPEVAPPPVPPTPSGGLGGVSWQEPSSEEVMAVDTAPPPEPGRNLPLAFLSAAVLAAVGIGAIAIGKTPFAVVASIVIVLAQGELYAALHRRGHQPATALGLVFGGLICAAAYLKGQQGAFAMFALGIVFTFLWFMSLPARTRVNSVVNIAMTLLPMAYVPLLASYVLMTLAFPAGGRQLMLAVLGLTFGYDILAFFFGSLWGQRALAPNISPRKSWEGVIGATLSLVAISLGIVASLDAIDSPSKAVGLALVIAVFAPLGDLAESLLKRDMGLKDIGSILPGHGGILDRIDSVLLAAPAAFYFFRLVLF